MEENVVVVLLVLMDSAQKGAKVFFKKKILSILINKIENRV